MSTTYDPAEYEAISRLFDLVHTGNGKPFELELLDARIAKGMEKIYQPGESDSTAGV